MHEARKLLARLDRIEALDNGGAPPHVLLREIRELVADADRWLLAEHGDTSLASEALDRCSEALLLPLAQARAR